ncbi:response regulator [Thioflexithrix psekupsensis]|uniref:Uncharacterized protein n=1 Tax=Thioflexithrix psekupsensis TaxID=1570016 RepID=A0A251X8Y7_9GAMM|nr:response regulator [Thioflexithrix psekupsensis]OUD14466.1 hypothetical protein TPSD3_09195 [Thioflexithrix psekupsensis]
MKLIRSYHKLRPLLSMPAIMGVITVISVFLITWGFDYMERDRHQQQVRAFVTEHLQGVRLRLEQAVQQKLLVARAISGYLNAQQGHFSQEDLTLFTRSILNNDTAIAQILFYQKQQQIFAYPKDQLLISTDEQLLIDQALQLKQIWMAGPIVDSENSRFILFYPDGENSLLAVFISRQFILEQTGLAQSHPHFIYALIGKNAQGPAGGIFWGKSTIFAQQPVVLEVKLPNGDWRLAGVPLHGWPVFAPISFWLWVAGFTLAFFGGFLVFTLFNAPRELRLAIEQATAQIVKLNQAYERFVPNGFLKLLHTDTVLNTTLGDQTEGEMTVLFSDIRDFTSISEKLSTRENFDYVNHYLGQMEPIIIEHHGLIDKYIGDAIMVIFPNDPDDAVSCAIKMLIQLRRYNDLLASIDYPLVHIGIGLNSGQLMLGIIGGQSRMDTTVIGDTVNLSARVESLTKIYGVPLLITEHTYCRLKRPEHYHIRLVGRVMVKGKSSEVTVYEVYDADSDALKTLKRQTQAIFSQAMQHFQAEEFAQALLHFEQVLTENPDDTVAAIYVHETKKILALTERKTPIILTVDDVQLNLLIMNEILSRHGFDMLMASSGEAALELVKTAKPHLILLDIMMPYMDGFEVCRRLKNDPETANIPVIFTTALTEVENKIEAFQIGAVDYITKPFQMEEVVARVKTHLTLYQLQQRLLARNEYLQIHHHFLGKKLDYYCRKSLV